MLYDFEILKGRQTQTIEHSIKISGDTFTQRSRTRTDIISDSSLDSKPVFHTILRQTVSVNCDEQFFLAQQWINDEPQSTIHLECPKRKERKKLKKFLQKWLAVWKPSLKLGEAFKIGGEPIQHEKAQNFEEFFKSTAGC